MADKNFIMIEINPNLIHTKKKDGTPYKNDSARISLPPTEKDGEWGTIWVKNYKDALKDSKDKEGYKNLFKPEGFVFHVQYGDKDNPRTEDIPAEVVKERLATKTKEAPEAEHDEAEQEGPELD